MVVTPDNPTHFSDEHVTYNEERTYREAIKSLRVAEHNIHDERLNSLDVKLKALADLTESRLSGVEATHITLVEKIDAACLRALDAVKVARTEAQTANDALQKLLEAAMHSSTLLSDSRFHSQEIALGKSETAIVTASKAVQTAIDTANTAQAAAVREVEAKSHIRQEATTAAVVAAEQKLSDRLISLQQLIDLRAKMNEDAVSKANDANEKRFESVNEFRAQLSDQTRDFVTNPVLDARMNQITTQTDTLDRQLRIDTTGLKEQITQLGTRVERREASENTKKEVRSDTHGSVGNVTGIIGGVVGVLGLIATLTFFAIAENRTPPLAVNPIVGADTKRVDDLVSRLNELTARLNPPGH